MQSALFTLTLARVAGWQLRAHQIVLGDPQEAIAAIAWWRGQQRQDRSAVAEAVAERLAIWPGDPRDLGWAARR
jgi:hypothetical protein